MRIGVFSPSWPAGSDPNGIVTYVGNLVPALRRLGHEVFILTHNRLGSDDEAIDLRSFQRPLPSWHRALFKIAPETAKFKAAARPLVSAIRHLVALHDIDILEMEETYGLSAAVSALNIVPVVLRLHGPWFITKRSNNSSDIARERREGAALMTASLITSPSRFVLNAVKDHYNIELAEGHVLFNSISPIAPEKLWRLSECDRDSILFVGRFDEIKGGDLILRVFGAMATRHSRLKLTFVGPDYGVYFEGRRLGFADYCRHVLSKEAQSRVTFLGALPHAQVNDLRRKHFVTVCASQTENLSYAVMEAMSFGCPIVSTSVGGIPEMIRSGENGLLVPSGDVEALACAVERLIADPQLAETLGAQASRDALQSFSADTLAAETVEVYQRAIRNFR
jgi:glycosyltransferase involved in cell wall biosynthesis